MIAELTDVFVLPAGGVLTPVSELSAKVRDEISSQEGDFVLSRPGSRVHAKVIDAAAAELIGEFREPSTIAQAVARYSRGKSAEPEYLLEQALPILQSLIGGGLLVRADSDEAVAIRQSLQPEQRIGAWTVVRCVQTMEDSETYQLRDSSYRYAALKIGRAGHGSTNRSIEREAAALAELGGSVTPRLFESAQLESRRYIVTEWIRGVDAHTVCAELRRTDDEESRRELLHATAAILRAYAHLHKQGFVHGDVHPRNVLADRDRAVKIIDLGLAHRIGESVGESARRGGISFFFEPEFAQAARRHSLPGPPTTEGEQYALAALLYLLITGSQYLDFSLERSEMLRMIAEAPMVPFERRGIRAWPDVEELLATALSKDPRDRFSSVGAFAERWQQAGVYRHAPAVRVSSFEPAKMTATFVERCAVGGPLINEKFDAPKTSLNYGSAGVAYALYRIACAQEDGECLALADLWSARSASEMEDEGAFYNESLEIDSKTVGRASLYHGRAGVFLVLALIAYSRGDSIAYSAAVGAFIETCRQPGEVLDLTLGRAGALLACAILLDTMTGTPSHEPDAARTALRRLGDDMHMNLWQTIDGYGPAGSGADLKFRGIAHGWAGLLYASMCWCAASGAPLAGSLERRLHELAQLAEPAGRGLQWKYGTAPHPIPYMPGWCNGSAGLVFLWTQAHRTTQQRKHLELAEGAAWNAWETPNPNPSLCCGSAGQAYALLNYYAESEETAWLRRARTLAESAARACSVEKPANAAVESHEWSVHSLYKGHAGVAVLAAEIDRPSEARMPLFQREL